jgi:hypothetical protein
MDEQFTYQHYSAEDIRRYVDGSMPAAERFALEKAALNDPFLSDAIEGYQKMMEKDNGFSPSADVQSLKEQIADHSKKKNRLMIFRLSWIRAAAIFIVVALAGSIGWYVMNRNPSPSPELATRKSVNPAAGNQQPSISVSDSVKLTPEKVKADAIVSTKKNESAAKANTGLRELRKDEEHAAEPAVASAASRDSAIIASRAEPVIVQEKTAASAIPPLDTKSFRLDKIADSLKTQMRTNHEFKKLVTGKVIDDNNQPVPSAMITLRNQKYQFLTDMYGNFKFTLQRPDSVLDIKVSGVGYTSAEASIRTDYAANTIRLSQNNTSLNEVVVTGYANRKKNNLAENENEEDEQTKNIQLFDLSKLNSQDAEPVTGWPAYQNYLQTQKKINTADSVMHGSEVISFRVNLKSELSAFRIEQSVSPSHDAEAIRLIMQGPSWRLLKGRNRRVMVLVAF